MHDSNPVSILADLVRIPSHEREDGVAEYLARRYEAISLPYRITEIGGEGRCNITVALGDGGPSIVLNSHMDTVPPGDRELWSGDPYDPRITGGKLFGRGACDAKGSLAAMVAAVERIATSEQGVAGRVVLMAVGAEESAGRGTLRGVEAGLAAEAAVIGEPTGLGVCICHKGVLRLRVRTRGTAVHASEPWNGKNAVSGMAEVIRAVDRHAEEVCGRTHPLLGRASLAVTGIRGGLARNVVPPSCEISLDRRLLPEEDPDTAEEEIRRITAEHGAITERELVARAAETPATDRVVGLALQARDGVIGDEGHAQGFTACCDMRFLTHEGGIPCVILGPGNLTEAHTADEYVEISHVEKASRIYEALIREFWGG